MLKRIQVPYYFLLFLPLFITLLYSSEKHVTFNLTPGHPSISLPPLESTPTFRTYQELVSTQKSLSLYRKELILNYGKEIIKKVTQLYNSNSSALTDNQVVFEKLCLLMHEIQLQPMPSIPIIEFNILPMLIAISFEWYQELVKLPDDLRAQWSAVYYIACLSTADSYTLSLSQRLIASRFLNQSERAHFTNFLVYFENSELIKSFIKSKNQRASSFCKVNQNVKHTISAEQKIALEEVQELLSCKEKLESQDSKYIKALEELVNLLLQEYFPENQKR